MVCAYVAPKLNATGLLFLGWWLNAMGQKTFPVAPAPRGPLTNLPPPEIFTGTISSRHHTVTSPPHTTHHRVMISPQTNSAPQVKQAAEHNTLYRTVALLTNFLLKSNPSFSALEAPRVPDATSLLCGVTLPPRQRLPPAPPPQPCSSGAVLLSEAKPVTETSCTNK